ncbi:variant erythrocyte surface antigen-1 alpha subunit [Babesia bovis T2Bo]|uniref:variant erythrocyte surface antigen-1 alpha subunit n=1 Tax=Babesia bovis T2Bo TaxID=484906 RepID=UPI001C36A711|nr:variant erythrocyte surface antigen-1 alpha subunit [Babesia bovis T2Bo]EDO05466.2 variant erythrocyte surface antigen-1 alpha subunit [Babesia bovis T2Bo]
MYHYWYTVPHGALGYDGDTKDAGATYEQVKEHLNGLFSLVQGLGGTAVVRTYIDQLAQVLSALVGWSKIEQCWNGTCKKDGSNDLNGSPHGDSSCKYLQEVKENTPCKDCRCMKWKVPGANDHSKGHHLGRGCTRCKDSGSSDAGCKCTSGGGGCSSGQECQCAKAGKCCKCCCTSCSGCKTNAKCSCTTEESITHSRTTYGEITIERYMSSYSNNNHDNPPKWKDASNTPNRHHCAKILLGSVCLIWSGVTYMHWTGKWASGSPYWNNHILDGSGLDDGTLSQWLQALGFPRDMLNNSGPQNRLDKVIWDGFMGKLFLGFTHPSGSHASDGNTAKQPYDMNYAGFVHTAHRDSFNKEATVFPKDGTGSSTTGHIGETNQNKIGAIFKLYVLSCAYFTGLQKRNSTALSTTPTATNNPKTIREILYWLSALPYSPAYPKILTHSKGRLTEVTQKLGDDGNDTPQLKFYQEKRWAPITVHQYNLFAHFQAVTQYCPLVLIGIQGGLHSTTGTDKTTEPPIHSLYSNTECHFTYPTVSIQAYNQVVHYIRALFYQLYFLRKQCAVKVTCGGKWRECRYGSGVLGKDVVSWMCLGCNPMEHDRKWRVGKVGDLLKGVKDDPKTLPGALKELLQRIGDVVVQLGNAQEALEKDINNEKVAVAAVKKAGVKNGSSDLSGVLREVLDKVNEKVKELEKVVTEKADGETSQALSKAKTALERAKEMVKNDGNKKNKLNAAHHGLQKVLKIFKKWLKDTTKGLDGHKGALLDATSKLKDICSSPMCSACIDHATKCGRQGEKKTCPTCHQQYMDGTPSPLQAFLEDRLPGFSCSEVLNDEKENPVYPPAASHLGHCGGSGQCCPLPMGFRNQFQKGGITDMTGQRLYGILYFFSNENMMQSCVYTLVRVTAELSATTPQVLGDVFGFFRGGVGEKERGMTKKSGEKACDHDRDPSKKGDEDYFCGWCASGLRDEVKGIQWIPKKDHDGGQYRSTVGQALIEIKGDKGTVNTVPLSDSQSTTNTSLSRLTENCQYLSPLTGELYTAVSATFGHVYLSWVLYLSDALEGGLRSLSDAFRNVECRGCRECDPNKCKKGNHGTTGNSQCNCSSIVSCTGVLPVLYRHGFSYGNPFNLEGYQQKDGKTDGQYDIEDKKKERTKQCHQFLDSLSAVIDKNKQDTSKVASQNHPLTKLLSEVGQLQYDIRLPWIFVLTLAWLVAVLYLAFGAIWPLDWTHMRSHWLRGGEHQWQCMWYKVMTGRKGGPVLEGIENFGQSLLVFLLVV